MQPDNDLIIDSPFEAALSERYLVYPYADIPAVDIPAILRLAGA